MIRNGLACPRCSEKMKVYYTRSGEGFVKRRRVCVSCEYAETTHERPVGVPTGGKLPHMERDATTPDLADRLGSAFF